MKKLVIALMLMSPSMAFAHSTLIEAVKDAVVTAIDQFQKDDPHAEHIFTGIREVKSAGANLDVKLSVNTSDKFVEYICVMDHSTEVEKFNCTKK